jgi:hypothetical protein
VNIYSSRSKEAAGIQAMKLYCKEHATKELQTPSAIKDFLQNLQWPTQKPAANMTIDDRAFCFQGNWDDPALDPRVLLQFKPWNKRGPETRTLPFHIQHLIDAINIDQKDLAIHLEASILKELYGPVTR